MNKKCPECKGRRWKVRKITKTYQYSKGKRKKVKTITKMYQCSKCAHVREETKKVLSWKEKDAINYQKENKKYKHLGQKLLDDVLR